jgi:hypothetical protein
VPSRPIVRVVSGLPSNASSILQSNADRLAVAVTLELFEIASVLVRLDHVTTRIENKMPRVKTVLRAARLSSG